MTNYQSPPSKGTPTAAQLLIAAIIAALIIAATACSDQEPLPTLSFTNTDRTDQQTTDRSLAQTMEAMAREISVLQTKAAVPTEPDDATRPGQPADPGQSPQPALAITPATPQTTDPPTRAVIPTPSGPGICGRSPEVQQVILNTLKTSSCRLVSNEELYRITSLSKTQFDTLRPGDLAGLVNLKGLAITGDDPLPPGAFAGASIEGLQISDTNLSPNAFQDMISIRSLKIVLTERQQIPTLTDPVFEDLEQLHLDFYTSDNGPELSVPPTGQELNKLKALKHFSIEAYTRPDSENLEPTDWRDNKPPFAIPASLFSENPKLETIDLHYRQQEDSNVRFQLVIPHTLVEHLHNLKKLTIERQPQISGRTLLEPPLALSPTSPLGKYLTPPDPVPDDWRNSSLYYELKNWYDWEEDGSTLQVQVPKEN